VTVAGVTAVCDPIEDDVSVQVAPGTPGVLIATTCVVSLVMVAHPAAASKVPKMAKKRM
jgi:hypothetical protein